MAKLWRNLGENTAKLRRNAGEIKATLWRNNGETLKIESTVPKNPDFFIQCPNDVMPDPDFLGKLISKLAGAPRNPIFSIS